MPPKHNSNKNGSTSGGGGGNSNSGKNKTNNVTASTQNKSNNNNNKKKSKNNDSSSSNNTNYKHSKEDNDFDALLSAAVEANKAALEKNNRKNNVSNNNNGNINTNTNASDNSGSPITTDGNVNRSKYSNLADREEVVPSSADHPENPYPNAFSSSYPRQTWPEPTIPVSAQFPHNEYPPGEICVYPLEINAYRHSNAEKRALELANEQQIQDLRHAAEVHRQVRTWAHSWIKPGISLMLLTDRIEKKLCTLIEKDGLHRGQAFPTGCSINHVAAHYTPNSGDEKVVLQYDDVMKVDFGTQINGHIIDCAWTVAFNPVYAPLLQAVKEATYEGIKQSGIDVRLCDIGAAIEEVMESYEVEINGTIYPVKSIRNLSGHNLAPYTIHSGKSVPIVKGGEQTKMEEGELFAIETFGSTGKGRVNEDLECSHYMMQPNADTIPLRSDKAQQLLKHIAKTYNTLAFCRKWLDRDGFDRHLLQLNHLCDQGAVNKYPPLCDVKGCYTAQFEHTILLKPTAKEILSKGNDY